MKVVVVGGKGYIGSSLVPFLEALRHKVWSADYGEYWTFGEPIFADAIIYLAGMSNNDMCERNPRLANALNEEPLFEVIKACKGKHFIYASSVAAYGEASEATEETLLNPTTLYGKSKKYAEELITASDLYYTIVRSASVCGYSPRMRYDLMINRMVRDAARTGKLTVNGGEQKRSHIHINDLCRFYAWLLENPQPRQTFNVVKENMSVMDAATLVARTIGKTTIDVQPYTDDRSYTVSGDKAKAAGFECKSSIEDAIVSVYLNTLYQ